MVRRLYEGKERVKTDFSVAISEMWYGWGWRENDPVFAELQDAYKELDACTERNFHIEWNIVDIDESHIYITNKNNGHRYHISVICPAALYVDVYCIGEDGSEFKAFAKEF